MSLTNYININSTNATVTAEFEVYEVQAQIQGWIYCILGVGFLIATCVKKNCWLLGQGLPFTIAGVMIGSGALVAPYGDV